MDHSYNVGDAKNNLPKLIKLAVSGQRVTITNRGKPVVELVPAKRKIEFGTHPDLTKGWPPGWEMDETWLQDFDFIREQDAAPPPAKKKPGEL